MNFDKRTSRGEDLLLLHCLSIGRFDEERLPAAERLERALGRDLVRLLLFALVRGQARGSSSP